MNTGVSEARANVSNFAAFYDSELIGSCEFLLRNSDMAKILELTETTGVDAALIGHWVAPDIAVHAPSISSTCLLANCTCEASWLLGAGGEQENLGPRKRNRKGDAVVQTGASELKFSIPKKLSHVTNPLYKEGIFVQIRWTHCNKTSNIQCCQYPALVRILPDDWIPSFATFRLLWSIIRSPGRFPPAHARG